MLRSTAHALVVVMLAASGHLLACGWECLDELVASAEASCHQEPAPATALNGDGMHACLPDAADPQVIAAKPAAKHVLVAAPPAMVSVTFARPAEPAGAWLSFQLRVTSPHPAAPSVLRI